MTARRGERILVPVFGGDIGAATFGRARAALDVPCARLMILHVASGRDAHPAHPAVGPADRVPRWRRLADEAPAFVDAVAGDPASVIVSQAVRFNSDRVLLEHPAAWDADGARIEDIIARVQRAVPGRVTVLDHKVRRHRHRHRQADDREPVPAAAG